MMDIQNNNKRKKWTNEMIKQEALKYNTRSDWGKNSTVSYCLAIRRKILNECTSHMVYKTNPFVDDIGIIYAYLFEDNSIYIGLTVCPEKRRSTHLREGIVSEKIKQNIKFEYKILESNIPNNILSDREKFYLEYYTREFPNLTLLNRSKGGSRGSLYNKISNDQLKQSALDFTSRIQWHDNAPKMYSIAVRRKLVDWCCAHMVPLRTDWNVDKAVKEGLKYSYVSEWQKNNKSSYNFLNNKGLVHLVTEHLEKKHLSWNEESILKEAQKYTSLKDWYTCSPKSYSSAIRLNLFDKCSAHMTRLKRQWDADSILADAKLYNNITKWIKASSRAYTVAKELNILKECTAHMVKHSEL